MNYETKRPMDVSTLHLSNQRQSTLRKQTAILLKAKKVLENMNYNLSIHPDNYNILVKRSKCLQIISTVEQNLCATLLDSIVDAFEHPSTSPVRIYI